MVIMIENICKDLSWRTRLNKGYQTPMQRKDIFLEGVHALEENAQNVIKNLFLCLKVEIKIKF